MLVRRGVKSFEVAAGVEREQWLESHCRGGGRGGERGEGGEGGERE